MIEIPPAEVLRESDLPGVELVRRGKVRDIWNLGEHYLLVASDRLSAFDVVFPGGIPHKGRVLTRLSLYWFGALGFENHVVASGVEDLPESCRPYSDQLRDRFLLVEKLEILPIECVVRGYLAGSGWREYRERGTVCSIELPPGLEESSPLPEPIFTPSTKAEEGHDENIAFEEAERLIGAERARELRERSIALYREASRLARERGIIIADTKLEWGVRPSTGEIVLADEVLTPDSSRFWPAERWRPGSTPPSFDKQYVRDHVTASGWDRNPPAPALPEEVVRGTSARYIEIFEKLTGEAWR